MTVPEKFFIYKFGNKWFVDRDEETYYETLDTFDSFQEALHAYLTAPYVKGNSESIPSKP